MVEPQAASLLLLSWDLWFLGYPDRSLARVSEALHLAQELDHPYTIAFAHYITSVVHLLRGDAARAFAAAEGSLEYRGNSGFRCTRFCREFRVGGQWVSSAGLKKRTPKSPWESARRAAKASASCFL